MNADDFRDYMLSFLFLRYLSPRQLRGRRPKKAGIGVSEAQGRRPAFSLSHLVSREPGRRGRLEEQMRRKVHYVIQPRFLRGGISEMARTQDADLLKTLQEGFCHAR